MVLPCESEAKPWFQKVKEKATQVSGRGVLRFLSGVSWDAGEAKNWQNRLKRTRGHLDGRGYSYLDESKR